MASAKSAKRVDPAPRSLGGSRIYDPENLDPRRFYVWVNKELPPEAGRETYEADGYRIETCQPEGPYLRGKKFKQGDEIDFRGAWLMSIDRETKDALYREGQRNADIREQQIRKRKGMFDARRGLSNMDNPYGDRPYVSFSEEVGPLKSELGGV